MTDELLGKPIGGWEIHHFLGSGKSAIVFQATREEKIAALKVFDPELIERFGRNVQLARIDRELQLRGKPHPNLVSVLDGGECPASGHLFVAMQFADAPNLAEVTKVVPRDRIGSIVSQVAQAAKYLEDLGLAHRDIKPSNIVVSRDFQHATLLDLGVLRPFGDPHLTDAEARAFIGTLRYSSPEFLFRSEKDTVDGWRAITFYQLGAVLHDLITGHPLFQNFSDPYARLVEAVRSETPTIESGSVSPELVLLAKNCLVKEPSLRLQLVRWEAFDLPQASAATATAAKERIRQRRTRAQALAAPAPERETEQEARARKRILDSIRAKLDANIRFECAGSNLFPPLEIHEVQLVESEQAMIATTLAASSDFDLHLPVHLWVRVTLLDVNSQAITIDHLAAVSRRQLTLETTSGRSWVPVFSGVPEDNLIRSRLANLLYLVLDKAQQVSQPDDIGDVAWIEVDRLEIEGHANE